MYGPDPSTKHPIPDLPQVCFIRNTITNPNIVVGDYTYYDDPEHPEDFERNVLYTFRGDRLQIGRFCAIARGVKFLLNGANHAMHGFSTYPFWIYGKGWEHITPQPGDLPNRGETVVGNDVWLGYEAVVMPGVQIGDGAIVGARAVVSRDVPPYAIVAGNPARMVKRRFSEDIVAALLDIAWWHWPIEKVTRNLERIVGADVDALRSAE